MATAQAENLPPEVRFSPDYSGSSKRFDQRQYSSYDEARIVPRVCRRKDEDFHTFSRQPVSSMEGVQRPQLVLRVSSASGQETQSCI